MSTGHGFLLRQPPAARNHTFVPQARHPADPGDPQLRHGAVLVAGIVQTPGGKRLDAVLAETLLSSYTKHLRRLVRARDPIRRIGPDRVALACPGVADWHELSALLERLQRSVGPPLPRPDGDGHVALSITGMLAQDAVERLLDLP
ncbi:hypothetical protein Kisp01_15860 [Kineosporia sp. NBRC 101677]|uniref:hypothetical protein n=1 Tax=Kineosporia sp. NBRC 101677 TaxID=3032197 RepID=UPI0024A10FB9|nr:hypothetical protein [Kineosporia sp. NBRC 101677]GLY14571.1 hypothetical protein Kisp01_15860 [Kineosporia sp. NBRC 101677]